jgi:hypothetical protein
MAGDELMGDEKTGPGPARSSAWKERDKVTCVDELLSATGTSAMSSATAAGEHI